MRHLLPVVLAAAACGKSGAASSRPDPTPTAVERPHDQLAENAKPYSMIVTPATAFAPGAPTKLQLELRDPDGHRVADLEVMHEKLLHLIVVSSDLSFFMHEHPEHRADGLLDHTLTLPHAGDYTVFADFTPKGGMGVVASASISVVGAAPAAVPLVPVELPAQTELGPYTVKLANKGPFVAGQNTILELAIRDATGPVSDLRDYLGARGHCVIVSADRSGYLHSHPLDGSGSTVSFHTVFPSSGTYKIWVEFRPRGEPLRVSYTVKVAAADSSTPPMAPMAPMAMDHVHRN